MRGAKINNMSENDIREPVQKRSIEKKTKNNSSWF